VSAPQDEGKLSAPIPRGAFFWLSVVSGCARSEPRAQARCLRGNRETVPGPSPGRSVAGGPRRPTDDLLQDRLLAFHDGPLSRPLKKIPRSRTCPYEIFLRIPQVSVFRSCSSPAISRSAPLKSWLPHLATSNRYHDWTMSSPGENLPGAKNLFTVDVGPRRRRTWINPTLRRSFRLRVVVMDYETRDCRDTAGFTDYIR